MHKKILEIGFYFFTFLSFSAITYEPPWRTSSMGFFAFIAAFCLILRSILNKEKIVVNFLSILFLFLFLSISISSFWQISFSIEKFSLATIFIATGLSLLSAVANGKYVILKNYLACITLCAIFSAFIILCQKFNILNSSDGLNIWKAEWEESHGRPYANFGQPNLAASLMLTGICCAVYLRKLNLISKSTLIFTVFLISVALAFSSSKSSFLALGIIFLLSLFFRKNNKSHCAFIFSVAIISLTKIIFSTRDIVNEGDISTGRFDLWLTMLDALSRHPFSGYGVLNTSAAHFEVRELHLEWVDQVIGSAHNLFFDFLLWFGIPLGGVVIVFTVIFFVKLIKNNIENENIIYLLIPLTVHSLFEYPLFNANFFMMYLTIVALSNLENRKTNISLIFPFILSFLLFLMIIKDYLSLSKNYTNLRYFESNFIAASKPVEINYYVLSDVIGQYNFFVKNKIESEADFINLSRITRQEPVIRNFCLMFNYLFKENRLTELNFWEKKSNIIFSEKANIYLQGCMNK